LTWRDTLLPFLTGYVTRHPRRLGRLWQMPVEIMAYVLAHHDRGRLKSRLIRAVMGGATRATVDAWAECFVSRLEPTHAFRPRALEVLDGHRRRGDHLVLLSASPDLYVPRIGRLLGFEHTLCTEIEWRQDRLDGALRSANRRGEEKSRCLAGLRARYPKLPIVAYGNSASDLPHLRAADHALLVNAGARTRRRAAGLGIPVADWT
jgi:phosphatidylglycerophosphatase C